MNRLKKSGIAVGVAAAGLGSSVLSPFAATLVTGIAAWIAVGGAAKFNVELTRWALRAVMLMHAAAAYTLTGSVPFALAAFFALVSVDMPNEPALRVIGSAGFTIWRLGFGAAAIVSFALAWPVGLAGLALLPAAGLVAMNMFFATAAIPELFGNRKGPKGAQAKVGHPAPDLVLPRRSGDGEFQLSAERGRHVLLCFLRGDWCPVCQVLMRIYRKAAPLLMEQGVKLVMINPSSGEEARAFAKDMGLDFEILVDAELAAARALGLLSSSKGMNGQKYPLPVSILVDREGVVRFISGIDDSTLLTPERMDRVLRTAMAVPS